MHRLSHAISLVLLVLGCALAAAQAQAQTVHPGGVITWGAGQSAPQPVPGALANVVQVGAGYGHYAALTLSGKVVCWGDNTFGQCNVPQLAQSGVKQISVAAFHTVALRADGSVVCWGDNSFGECSPPASALTGVVQVSAAGSLDTNSPTAITVDHWMYPDQHTVDFQEQYGHSMALKSDGTVVCWGSNSYGESTVPAGLTGVKQIAAAAHHSMALLGDGSVKCWGDDSSGQCSPPPDLTNVTRIGGADAMGFYWIFSEPDYAEFWNYYLVGYSFSQSSDGTLRIWGDRPDQLSKFREFHPVRYSSWDYSIGDQTQGGYSVNPGLSVTDGYLGFLGDGSLQANGPTPPPTDAVYGLVQVAGGSSDLSIGLQAISLSNDVVGVPAGSGAAGHVTVFLPVAPTTDQTIRLVSDTSKIGVPASVVVKAGTHSATAPISVAADTSIATHFVSASYGGATGYSAVYVRVPKITGITVNPTAIVGGTKTLGNVVLDLPAPAAGSTVSLHSSDPRVRVAADAVVPFGSISANFSVVTAPVITNVPVTITAKWGASTATKVILVEPFLQGFSNYPSTIPMETFWKATLNLNGPAPAGGLVVNLSSDLAVVIPPSKVKFPAGSTSQQIMVAAGRVSKTTFANLTATLDGAVVKVRFAVSPD